MGWKTQTVLIRPAALDAGPDKLLADLGYVNHRKIDETSFPYAGAGSIWIGSIGECIVMYTHLSWAFFEQDEAGDKESVDFRSAMLRHFLESDIVALFLDSVTEAWGFAVFRNGALIRRQYGYDGSVLCNEGSRSPVEETYIANFQRIETAAEITYRDPNHPGYDMTEADLGTPLVFEFCRSLTGVPLDKLQAHGSNFWLNNDEERISTLRRTLLENDARSVDRPWWKFWS
jgi:Family of unknown function (DUF6928)